MKIKNIFDIKNIYYINLNERIDRKNHIEEQLSKLNLKGNRFNAIKNNNGALGCTLSHIGCLEIAVKNNFDHILVLEDDVLFLEPELFINQFNKFLQTHDDWDVVFLGGNNIAPYTYKDDYSIKVSKCQCATAYLINTEKYIQIVLNNFRESITQGYPCDLYWWDLQQKDNWYLIIPMTVVQREDYSDIEKKNVNYIEQMKDLKY